MISESVFDLCVIGAGMFGSAAARHASANPSLRVCLLGPEEPKLEERPGRKIFASHYDEGRMVRIIDELPACQALTKESVQRYGELEKLSGIPFYTPLGFLFMGHGKGMFMQSTIQAADSCKSSFVELFNSEIFRKRFPYLQLKPDEGAIFEDNGSGHISPRKLVQAQKKVAQLQGCTIVNDVACRITTSPSGMHVVHTEKGDTITAKRLIVSTGAFINLKDLEVLKPLKVKRCRETVVLLKIPEDEVKRLNSLPALKISRKNVQPSNKQVGCYILPPIKYPDGNYYMKFGDLHEDFNDVCETLDQVQDWYLSNGDEEILKTHLPLVTDLFPGLQYIDVSKFTCVTCHTATGLPYIDRVSPTITVAIGGNRKGAKFSDEVGRIAANLSLTGRWDSNLNQNQFKAIFE